MPRLVWTPYSSRDLSRLYDFLEPKDRNAAIRAIKTIRQRLSLLARHPEMGRPVDEAPVGRRELVIDFGQSSYVALYQLEGEHILVLAIRYGREAGY
jgi:plasmid stabilization system protein ParE